VDATVFLGVYGFKVPAIALQPLAMISCANCLASASVANLRVPRTHLRSPRSGLGKMFERYETYQISGFFNGLPLGQTSRSLAREQLPTPPGIDARFILGLRASPSLRHVNCRNGLAPCQDQRAGLASVTGIAPLSARMACSTLWKM
jgi:hypothetical protein